MAELLCIPLKRSLKLDLSAELSKVIDGSFYQVASVFSDDLQTIAKMRDAALEADVSTQGLNTLLDYYVQFSQLKKKFPDEQIKFKWFETLGLKSLGREESRFIFEELNIVYNIGALYLMLAADANNGSIDGLKNACLYTQKSAGCFAFISHEVGTMNDPVMEQSSVQCLENLTLAQAQELFWLKAVRDGLKNSLIARLAIQVSYFYDAAYKYANLSELIRTDWARRFRDKSLYFQAVASYRSSMHYDELSEYGLKVKALRDSTQYLKGISAQDASTEAFIKKIHDASKTAERDNDLIYLQDVPSSIPQPKPAIMVKSLKFECPESGSSKEAHGILFQDLLPISIMESSVALTNRQREYIRQHIIDPLNALSKILKQKVPSYEVPASVRPIDMQELETCERSMKEARLNAKRVESVLHEVSTVLTQEQDTDEMLRSKYGTLKWTLPSSKETNTEYWSKYDKIKSYLNKGDSIDNETYQLFESIDKTLLTAPIKLPECNNPLMKEVSAAIERRQDLITKIENKSSSNVLLPKIISAYKRSGQTEFEDLFAEHLKIFREDLEVVETEKNLNNKLIEKLSSAADSDGKIRRLDARDLYVQDFKHSLKLFEDVKENVEGGSKFYEDLVKSVSALSMDVTRYEAERRVSKRDLEDQLTNSQ